MCLGTLACSIVYMAESSSSFIPKRSGNTNRTQPTKRGNFFVFSVISYALFVAAPLASGAVFIYDKYVQKQFVQTVINLDSAIKVFSEADMQRVTEFDERLVVANTLLDSHVSFLALFSILEASSAVTVQFESLSVERINKDTLHATAAMSTDSFDALLFQRAIYDKDTKLTKAELSDIQFAASAPATESESNAARSVESSEEKNLSLSADFIFSADQILYSPTLSISNETPDTPATSNPMDEIITIENASATTTNQTEI